MGQNTEGQEHAMPKNNMPLDKDSENGGKEKQQKPLDEKYGLRKWVYRLILYTIIIGLLVPFGTQAVCTLWYPSAVNGVEVWNDFVGIALGVVATILGVVSLIMGFKNYDDTLLIQEKFTESLDTANRTSSQTGELVTKVSEISNKLDTVYSNATTSSTLLKPTLNIPWGKEPKEASSGTDVLKSTVTNTTIVYEDSFDPSQNNWQSSKI